VVDAQAPYSRQITLRQYLAVEHIGVAVMEGTQNIPEKRLAARGERRRTVITLPYFGAAVRCVPQSGLMLTAPRRFAMAESGNRAVKVLKAPAEITGFKYLMVWHPRVNTDAAHVWLRSTMSRIGKGIPS
jgi:DNA-binding transcriptional LysR family regulator